MEMKMEQITMEEEANEEKNKIASEILKVLSREQVTVSEAISILGIAKEKILKARINLFFKDVGKRVFGNEFEHEYRANK